MTSSRFLPVLKLVIPLCIICVLSVTISTYDYRPAAQVVEAELSSQLDMPTGATSLQRQPDSSTIVKSSIIATYSSTTTTTNNNSTNSTSPPPWKPTPETPYEVCFVTAVYGDDPEYADHPPNVTNQRDEYPTSRFFAFTNMPDIKVDGWTVIIKNSTQYRRYITRSRWPKFMSWTHPEIVKCQAVFYMDGFCGPRPKAGTMERLKVVAREIAESKYGISQNQHEDGGGALAELDRILHFRKDIAKNTDATRAWFHAQPDFNPNCTLYANHFIGFDPKSQYWQKAAQFFWDRYSQELDSWRDQPLWCYVLDKFKIEPADLEDFNSLFRDYWKFMAKDGHKYDATADRKGQ